MLFATTNCNTLLHTDTCTEVTTTDTLRISSFKKIRFKYLENGSQIENVTNTSTLSGNSTTTNVVMDHHAQTLSQHKLGIKRTLSQSSCNENDEFIFMDRTRSSDGSLEYSSPSAGGGAEASFQPPTPYSPTLSFPNTTTTTNTTINTNQPLISSYSPPKTTIRTTRKLRIVHDRYNPFLIDKLLEAILSYFSLSQLKIVALVSKRWNLFASNRLNQLMFFTPPYDLFSSSPLDRTDNPTTTTTSYLDDGDIQEAVCGLEKIKDVVNQRLRRLSQIRRHRLTARFLLWRDNGQDKQAMPSPPPWAFWLLHTYGFPLSEFRTYTVDEVFHWIMNNYQMDDQSKEEWSSLIMASNVVAFVFRPCAR